MSAIQQYLDVLQDIMPEDDTLVRPCLWHADLHASNVFVDPEHPTTVTSIIDWQSVDIAPLFVQVRQPGFLDFDGPQVKGLEQPELPKNLKDLSPTERRRANFFI